MLGLDGEPIRGLEEQQRHDKFMAEEAERRRNDTPDTPPPGGILVAMLISLAGAMVFFSFWNVADVFTFLTSTFLRYVPLPQLAAAALAVAIGYVLFQVREITKSGWYPPAELFVGVVAASYGVTHQGEALAGIIAFVAGTRIIVDSFARAKKFADERKS